MYKIVFSLFLLSLLGNSLRAQSGLENRKWEGWITVYQEDTYPEPTKVEISFSYNTCYTSGGLAGNLKGYSFFRTRSNFSRKGATVSFHFTHLGCDGKTNTESVTVELDKPKNDMYIGNWFLGYVGVAAPSDVPKYTCYSCDQQKKIDEENAKRKKEEEQQAQIKQQQQQEQNRQKQQQQQQAQIRQAQQQAQQRADQQKQQYSNTASNYLNAAQNSPDGISKAMDLNLAKINAAASGNTALVKQIQAIQDEQAKQNSQELQKSVSDLLNTLIKPDNTPPPNNDAQNVIAKGQELENTYGNEHYTLSKTTGVDANTVATAVGKGASDELSFDNIKTDDGSQNRANASGNSTAQVSVSDYITDKITDYVNGKFIEEHDILQTFDDGFKTVESYNNKFKTYVNAVQGMANGNINDSQSNLVWSAFPTSVPNEIRKQSSSIAIYSADRTNDLMKVLNTDDPNEKDISRAMKNVSPLSFIQFTPLKTESKPMTNADIAKAGLVVVGIALFPVSWLGIGVAAAYGFTH
jgi:hypothetical protein